MDSPFSVPPQLSEFAWRDAFHAALADRLTETYPFQHWFLRDVLPRTAAAALLELPFKGQQTAGLSGRRELHNASRQYLDSSAIEAFPACRQLANLFQSKETVATLAKVFDANLDGTYLRIEFAADIDGFWLEPHTDLGVKKFTLLYYLSAEPGQLHLGTDIYAAADQYYSRAPFLNNTALVFVPSDRTWHGFERRPIKGIRKSIIINFVTEDWRAKEQLAFPETPVRIL